MWTMFVFFAWILFFWLLFTVFGDLFGRHDIGGWGKAGWTIFVIVLPFIGILAYLVSAGSGMAERRMKETTDSQAQMDAYVRSVAGSRDPAGQIAKAKDLLDRRVITEEEFAQLKADALAG
jgi:hypothetical protein